MQHSAMILRFPILTIRDAALLIRCPNYSLFIRMTGIRPIPADRDWLLCGNKFDRINFNNYHFATFKDFSEWEWKNESCRSMQKHTGGNKALGNNCPSVRHCYACLNYNLFDMKAYLPKRWWQSITALKTLTPYNAWIIPAHPRL